MSAPAAPQMGVCRFCGCTDANACRLPDGEPCGWVDQLRTVCSNWSCLARWSAERKRDREARRKQVREFRGAICRSEMERRRREIQERRAKALRRKKPKGTVA